MEDYVRTCSPQIKWLVTDPISLIIIVACSTLAILHYTGMANNLPPFIDAKAVSFFWYFSVVVHVFEAIYVAYLCRTKANLSAGITMKWFVFVCCTGWPMASRFMNLIQDEKEKKKAM